MQYSSSKKCDTFDRNTKGRTWLAGVTSQEHPDYLLGHSNPSLEIEHLFQLQYAVAIGFLYFIFKHCALHTVSTLQL